MSGAHKVTWWGAFDPYTFGVWISEDKVHDFPDPTAIDRLYLLTLAAPPTAEHKRFVDACITPEDRYLAVTAFSVYAHEWRHWYDLTSTPFGMARLGQLAAFYATLVSIEPIIDNLDRIYVPLSRWVRSPDMIHTALGLPPLPPDLIDVFESATTVLKKADVALQATRPVCGTPVSTRQILEGLAMLEQEQHVCTHFGARAATDLRQRMMNAGPGGRAYYAAVHCAEQTLGSTDRARVTTVLESTLFIDYGTLGSAADLTPPELLNAFLDEIRRHPSKDLEQQLDRVLLRHQGWDRAQAFNHCWFVVRTTLDQITAAGKERGTTSGAQSVRRHLGVCVKDALLWGGAARMKNSPILDEIADSRRRLPEPDAYVLQPPMIIEGNPGRTTKIGAQEEFIYTLAGSVGPAWAFSKVFGKEQLPDVLPNDVLQQSVVWTPKLTGTPNYFGLLNIFRHLMYWRGIVFGPGGISPFTYDATTVATAREKGQSLVGPQMRPRGAAAHQHP